MEFIGRIIRYLFWVLVVTWTVSLLRRLVAKMGAGATHSEGNIDVPNDAAGQKLVRDPVCGIHIAEAIALPVKQGNEVVNFCSAECRDRYLSDTRKFAANA